MSKVLIVEDDILIAELERDYLNASGFEAEIQQNGTHILDMVRKEKYDALILDIMLPGKSGLDICRELRRESSIPILMVTAKKEEVDKLRGLGLGADDYMIKPFDSKELVARVKAVLRRYQAVPAPAPVTAATAAQQQGDYVEYPDLIVNLSNYAVLYQGKSVDMPPKELELLYFLASSPNQVFTREQLLDHIWGYEYIGDTRTVDVHIKRLREKIKDNDNWALTTVWGIGYKFEVKR